MSPALDLEAQSLHEEAADELARLDERCATAPTSIPRALWLRAVADLSGSVPDRLPALMAAEGDLLHEAALGDTALRWRSVLDSEERRVRGGAFLSTSRLAEVVPALGTYAERSRLGTLIKARNIPIE